jgi:hypothetical protein
VENDNTNTALKYARHIKETAGCSDVIGCLWFATENARND